MQLIDWNNKLKLSIMSEGQKKEDPIFVGNGVSKFDGNLIEISVCLNDVEPHKFEYNGKWYTKLKVNKKKEVDQYGKTHSVSINTWKPEPKNDEF